jgi:hypothetical protein
MVLDDAGLKDRVKSPNSIINLNGPRILEIMLSPKYNVLMEDLTIIKDVQEYVVPSRERDFLNKLKDVQDPLIGRFFFK